MDDHEAWKASIAARVRNGLAQYFAGANALVPKNAEEAKNFLLSASPGYGNYLSAKEVAPSYNRGDYDLALGSAIGAFPLFGGMAKPFTVNYFGKSMKVLHNPSPQETTGFLNNTKYKAARRIVDPETGDVFIWDAADPALHHMMAEKVGVDPKKMTADMIGID